MFTIFQPWLTAKPGETIALPALVGDMVEDGDPTAGPALGGGAVKLGRP